MSIPERVYSFAQYWKKVLRSSTEAREMVTWLLALMAGLVGWVEQWAKVPAFLPWLSYLIAGALILWGILWPPYKVYEEQRRAHEAAEAKLREAHAYETIGFYRELEQMGSPVKAKHQQIKIALAHLLGQLDARISEIKGMSSMSYIASLQDPTEKRDPAPGQLAKTVNAMLDKASLELIARIALYLEENVAEEQAKSFKNLMGIVLTPVERSDDPQAIYTNRQRLYLDHLQHWSKNLAGIIQGLE